METGKGKVKWIEAKHEIRMAYVRQVLSLKLVEKRLFYDVFTNSERYLVLTILTIARSIFKSVIQDDYQASVFIDGLPKNQEMKVATELRHLQIRIRKVRGVRKDENDSLIRLVDALCGLVRLRAEGKKEVVFLLDQAEKRGVISRR